MAVFPFRLPDIGEGIAEAEIVAWHVAPGDMVEEDQPIADVMTDKATIEMTSPVDGRVTELGGAVGDTIAIGAVLMTFETEGALAAHLADDAPAAVDAVEPEVPAPPVETAPVTAPAARILASPAVRARATALGIDLGAVRPAQGDRIRHADLDAFLRYDADTGAPPPRVAIGGDRVETIKLVGMRRRIADKMAESKRHIPHFSYVEEIDVTALESLRAAMNEGRGERPRLTLLPFLVRAMVRAIADFPMVNARFDDAAGEIERHDAVHLGIATQTEAGLTVPVLRDAGRLDMWQIASEIARLAEGARAGRLPLAELSGSTITLTSLGALGGIVSTPIINRPEVAIVGVNRMVERPVVIDGRIEVRKMMNLSSSFDHRIVDGHDAASFIQALRRMLEAPGLILA